MTRTIRVKPAAFLAVLTLIVAAIVIGQVIASELGLSGVRRVLVCSAAALVLSWCVIGALAIFGKRHRSYPAGGPPI